MRVSGVSEGEERHNGEQKVFEEIMIKRFSILLKYLHPQVKRLSKPMEDKHKKVTYRPIIKLLKTKEENI